jgi:glycosyltransferase involved in cell wall biosynthesis
MNSSGLNGDLSVVMPLYNAEPYVRAAIQSVLDGAEGLLELIVVDDGSTDDGAEVARSFGDPVRVLEQPNAGPSAARNLGIREARGELIGFLDADDLWQAPSPDPRRAMLSSGTDFALGIVQPFVQPDLDGPIHFAAEPMSGVQMATLIAPLKTLRDFGEFNEALVHGEDLDFMLRIRESELRMELTQDVVVLYRIRPGSLTRDRATSKAALTERLKESIDRRRGAQ